MRNVSLSPFKLAALAVIAAPLALSAAEIDVGTGVNLTGALSGNGTVYSDTYVFTQDAALNFTRRTLLNGATSIKVNEGVTAKITSTSGTRLSLWHPGGGIVLGDNSILEIDLNSDSTLVRYTNKGAADQNKGSKTTFGENAKIKLTRGIFYLSNAENEGTPGGYMPGTANDPNVELSNYIFNGGILNTDRGHETINMTQSQAIGRLCLDIGNNVLNIKSGVAMTSASDSARNSSWIAFYNSTMNYGFDSADAGGTSTKETGINNGYGGENLLNVESNSSVTGINFLFGTNNDTVKIAADAEFKNNLVRMDRGDDLFEADASTLTFDERSYDRVSNVYAGSGNTSSLTTYADIDLAARTAINARVSYAIDSDNDIARFTGTTINKSTNYTFLAMGNGSDTATFDGANITRSNTGIFAELGAGDDAITFKNTTIADTGTGNLVSAGAGNDTINFEGTNIKGADGATIIDFGAGDDTLNLKDNIQVGTAEQSLTIAMGEGSNNVNIEDGGNITFNGATNFTSSTTTNNFNVKDSSQLTLDNASLSFAGTFNLEEGSTLLFKNDTVQSFIEADVFEAYGTIKLAIDASGLVEGDLMLLVDAQTISGSVSFDMSEALLSEGLYWDFSYFYTDGSIRVAAIPEPATIAAMLGALALGLAAYRRRKN